MTYKNINKKLITFFISYIPIYMFVFSILFYYYSGTQNLIVFDENTISIHEYSSKIEREEELKYIAESITESFLNRNPNGLDKKLAFRRLFTNAAYKYASGQISSEREAFDDHEIHQKSEIFPFELLESSRERVFMQIPGQLIRSFRDGRKKKIYTLTFLLSVELHRNYNLQTNARYPYAVINMTYEQSILD